MIDKAFWHEVTESQFTHEKEGLASLRNACLPSHVLEAWTNFEFLDDSGRLYEIDALLLTRQGLTLVELKHYRGEVGVDELTWVCKKDAYAPAVFMRSPLSTVNHKCKVLASLLRRGPNACTRVFVQALVVLTHPDVKLKLNEPSRLQPICDVPGLKKALAPTHHEQLTSMAVTEVRAALEKLGIRKSRQRQLMVGDYRIDSLLGDGQHYQDHLATSIHLSTQKRRIRTFVGSSPAERDRARRTAHREFNILDGLSHDYILSPSEFKEWEQGPALVFQYFEKAEPLDLLSKDSELSFGDKLVILQQIGEALRYAHGRNIFHRALTPKNVLLVREAGPTGKFQVKVMNWQTVSALERTSGTVHLTDWMEEQFTAYLAPEMLSAPNDADASVDLFSLGCIAYFLFTGQSPASSQSELQSKLLKRQGLSLLSVLDQVSFGLEQLVFQLTNPNPACRIQTAQEFLDKLANCEKEAFNPSPPDEPESNLDLHLARSGDLILPGLKLVRKLGQGSSSVAFLLEPVQYDDSSDGQKAQYSAGEKLVLKTPLPSKDDHDLKQEAEILEKLENRNIVQLRSKHQFAGKTAILLTSAGDETLSERLARQGFVGLELLQRFGCDLLGLCHYLETIGVAHRDIKPANLGVRKSGKNDELHLCLFDFSLSRQDRRKVEAGTPNYRDPFLHAQNRPWDEFAERYAAAVTLYECATCRVPQWGDGRANPAVVECEVVFNPGDFEESLRAKFEEFFRKAFQRDYRLRHENATEMLAGWNSIFQDARADESPLDLQLPDVVPSSTALKKLIQNPSLNEIFQRLNLLTAGALVGVPRNQLLRLSNVGGGTRNQLRNLYDLLQARLEGEPLPYVPAPEAALESLLDLLVTGLSAKEGSFVKAYLSGSSQTEWPTHSETAKMVGHSPKANLLSTRRQKWAELERLKELSEELQAILEEFGGVATIAEICDALLSRCGCLKADPELRFRTARGILRALLETEDMTSLPKFELARLGRDALVCSDLALAQRLAGAAELADKLVQEDPPPSTQRMLNELSNHCLWGMEGSQSAGYKVSDGRMERLITSLASKARLSTRGDFYVSGQPPQESLRLVSSLLAGKDLKPEEVGQLVLSRYPDAAPIDCRVEALESQFRSLNLPLVWSEERHQFRPKTLVTTGRSRTTSAGGVNSLSGPIQEIEQRLQVALQAGEPQVIKVPRGQIQLAEDWLHKTFGLTTVSLEDRLVTELCRIAEVSGFSSEDLFGADAIEPREEDWAGLVELAGEAADEVLKSLDDHLVVKRFSLWSRYGLLGKIQQHLERAARSRPPKTFWLLAPNADGLPTVDGHPLPIPPGTRPIDWNASALTPVG
jgi:serine/threonine protein kinase